VYIIDRKGTIMNKPQKDISEMTGDERTVWEYEKDMEMADLAGYPIPERMTANVCTGG
jgi:hypothetical protein